ncbi:MAG: hypothetical protein P8I38_15995 [Arenicella sp.]|jgi:hypothetical protein|nr:hypothetical protein [Arenicella sp.]HAU67404.1 hypothetical protein [Gammaproteobacteria bacterium]
MNAPALNKVNDVIQLTNPKFVFQHQDNEIVWVLQLLTGVKTLYVNGEQIKRDYSIWCRSGHYDIKVGEQTYKLNIRQDSSATYDFKEVNAPLVATLVLDERELETRRYVMNIRDIAKYMGYSLIAGAILAVSLSHIL